MSIEIRKATPEDRDAVIALHISLSQFAYGHIFSEAYLMGTLIEDKHALWGQRLGSVPDNDELAIQVAEMDGVVVGFSCFVFDDGDIRGAYLHNLYVDHAAQHKGVARRLIAAGLERFPARFAHRPVYLKALEENRPACAIYERLGGEIIARETVTHPQSPPAINRVYSWRSRDALRAALAV
jgi:ribosomal protein S18 acetylase RimI-like enzyme